MALSSAIVIILSIATAFTLAWENVFWFILTGIFHYTARLLGGNGRFQGLMSLTGFSRTPLLVINAALFIVALFLRDAIPTFEYLNILIIFSMFGRIWECWLSVLSVSISHNLSKRASIVCAVLPEIVLVTIYMLAFLSFLGVSTGVY